MRELPRILDTFPARTRAMTPARSIPDPVKHAEREGKRRLMAQGVRREAGGGQTHSDARVDIRRPLSETAGISQPATRSHPPSKKTVPAECRASPPASSSPIKSAPRWSAASGATSTRRRSAARRELLIITPLGGPEGGRPALVNILPAQRSPGRAERGRVGSRRLPKRRRPRIRRRGPYARLRSAISGRHPIEAAVTGQPGIPIISR